MADLLSTDVYSAIGDYLHISTEAAIILVLVLLVWKLLWYSIALYNIIERKQKVWFVVLFMGVFVLNDLGILAIIYLILYRKRRSQPASSKITLKKSKRR